MALTVYTAGEVLTAASLNANLAFAAGSGGVVQVKSTTLTSTFSTASTSYTALTGLSVSITPTSASNKVLVMANISCGSSNIAINFRLSGGNTSVAVGDAAGVRTRAASANILELATDISPINFTFLDSPATTSATTYGVQLSTNSGTIQINRTNNDADSAARPRMISTITVMEVTP